MPTLVQGRWLCNFFVNLGNNWFFVVVVIWYPNLSSGNGRPMDWLFLLSLAADRGCVLVMAPILLYLNNSIGGSLFSALPSLFRRCIICIRCFFLVTDLCWCLFGGGLLRLIFTNNFFRSLLSVVISGFLRQWCWLYLWRRFSFFKSVSVVVIIGSL